MSLRQRSSVLNQPYPSDDDVDTPPSPPPKSVLSQALQSTAHLANLLPTGTVLAFQFLTPIFTNGGACDSTTRNMTILLLLVLAASCLLASFTDSVKSSDGHVHYGFVTLNGLWLFYRPGRPVRDLSRYRLTLVDVVHAALSVLVFVAVALMDRNVVSCLYGEAGRDVEEVLRIAPIGIGFIASLLFVVFPSTRHGIGYPVTPDGSNR